MAETCDFFGSSVLDVCFYSNSGIKEADLISIVFLHGFFCFFKEVGRAWWGWKSDKSCLP